LNKGRLEAFSDGVIAIIITIMAPVALTLNVMLLKAIASCANYAM